MSFPVDHFEKKKKRKEISEWQKFPRTSTKTSDLKSFFLRKKLHEKNTLNLDWLKRNSVLFVPGNFTLAYLGIF